MHAFLIAGGEKAVNEKINKMTKKGGSQVIEFPLVKISDVRELEKYTSRSREKTTIISKHIEKSSTESLNAFLKNLEEPNKNITYILTTDNINKILPTIVSRCEAVILKQDEFIVKNKTLVKIFLEGNIGKKFSIIDKIKNKYEAGVFINDLTFYLHKKLKDTKNKHLNYVRKIKAVKETDKALQLNGNVKLHLTRLVINLK